MRETIIQAALLHDLARTFSGEDHPEEGARWAEQAGFSSQVCSLIRSHHLDGSNDTGVQVLILADRLAEGTLRSLTDAEQNRIDLPPSSVFDLVLIPGRSAPLSYQSGNHSGVDYSHRLEGFKLLLNKLGPKGRNADNINQALRASFSEIPSQIEARDQSFNPTLYRHLSLTAAHATCLIDYCGSDLTIERLKRLADNEQAFMFVRGDFSGIQDFVYSTGSQKALKNIRARAFFLQLLTEHVVSLLLDRLHLPFTNVLYSAGGSFGLLVPNTKDAVEVLKVARREINDTFLDRYGTKLYLGLGWRACYPSELIDDRLLGQVIRGVDAECQEDKQHRWKWRLADLVCSEPGGSAEGTGDCQNCGTAVKQGISVCLACEEIINLSQEFLRTGVVYQYRTNPDRPSLRLNGYYYSAVLHKDPSRVFSAAPLVDSLESWNNKELAGASHYHLPTPSVVFEDLFEELVKHSKGVRQLGVFRMDVDLLGAIMAAMPGGLGMRSELSGRLEHFFKEHLPGLLRGDMELLDGSRSRLAVNLVYAGGDDLFVLGTWDAVWEAAWATARNFRDYVGGNPALTLSAGIVVADHRLPLYRVAELAGNVEISAKDAGRDCMVFGSMGPVGWDNEEALKTLLPALLRAAAKSRGFLDKAASIVGSEDAWSLPRLYYLLRHTFSQAELVPIVNDILGRTEGRDLFRLGLRVAEMLTRKGGEGA